MKIFLVLIGIFCYSLVLNAQQQIDSAHFIILPDSANAIHLLRNQKEEDFPKTYSAVIQRMLAQNHVLNFSLAPVDLVVNHKAHKNKNELFYLLISILLLLGILKIFYSKYFNNIFRVFFNTSLRQNQITDILLQAKLPSLIFNIFFVLSAGFYVWSLFNYFQVLKTGSNYKILFSCIAALGLVYLGKFLVLKFIGWVSGMQQESHIYIFITFLINKILGIILLPFTILMIFGTPAFANIIAIISLFVVALLFLSRYYRSYSLLQNRLNFSWFPFLIYVAAIEIIPILIISKAVVNFLA